MATALLGHHAAYYAMASLVRSVGRTAVFAPIAVYRYRGVDRGAQPVRRFGRIVVKADFVRARPGFGAKEVSA